MYTLRHMNCKTGNLLQTASPKLCKAIGGGMLSLLLLTACSEHDEDPRASMTQPLTFYLQTSGEQGSTRAHEGDLTATTAEKAINDIKVWLFDSEIEGLLLDYQDALAGDGKVVMKVPQYIVEQGRAVDVYAIANASTVGLSDLGRTTTLQQLKETKLQGTNFTPTGATSLNAVTALPFSRVLRQWSVVVTKDGKNQLKENLGVVDMVRGVSKIRFAFARTTGLKDVHVTGIELDGSQFPTGQYIFPVDSINDSESYTDHYHGDLKPHINATDGYITNKLVKRTDGDTDFTTTLISCDDIREYDNPASLTWASQKAADESLTASGYNDLVNSIINGKYDLTTYLRESDKALAGTVHYTSAGVARTARFQMDASQAGDFARNHEWTVYGYFQGEELVLTVNVMPWQKWLRTSNYKENVSVSEQVKWTEGTYADKETMTIDGTPYTVMVLRYGTSLEGTFSFDTPYGGTWMAILEPINGSENGSIVFNGAEATTTLEGTIGTSAVAFQVKAAQNQVSHNQYARLRFVCYSQDHQPYHVADDVIGGPYIIAQYAN